MVIAAVGSASCGSRARDVVFIGADCEILCVRPRGDDVLIQKLRLQRGWSQQQLAEASGLSVRTIQRIEAGQLASTETLKSIAAVFEIDFSTLNPENTMNSVTANVQEQREREALSYVRKLRRFYLQLFQFTVIGVALVAVNLVVKPGYLWSLWAIGGLVFAVVVDAFRVFGPTWMLGPDWERRQVEKRLGRPL